jgi:hypothetical protein
LCQQGDVLRIENVQVPPVFIAPARNPSKP